MSTHNQNMRHKLLACLLLFFLSIGDAYINSPVPYNSVEMYPPSSSTKIITTSLPYKTKRRVMYDLGIDKNRPVARPLDGVRGTDDHIPRSTTSRDHIVQYFIEHLGVNSFPRPVVEVKPTKQRKVQLPLIPQRTTDDLIITSGLSSLPRMTLSQPRSGYDINTPWIEFWIHHEREVKDALTEAHR